MGDISIIARRLSENYVQYGFSGGSGYFKNVGFRILNWYRKKKLDNFPEYENLIDYLFSLGTTDLIGKPGSEYGGFPFIASHSLCHKPFDVGRSERDIFSKIAFIDYGYFFDSDEQWYYIVPGPFRIKIPIMLIDNNLDENDFEFDFLKKLKKEILKFILLEYENPKFDALIQTNPKISQKDRNAIFDEVIKDHYPIHYFWEHFRILFEFFDDWILVQTDAECKNAERFIIRENGDEHIETIFWK